MVVIKKYNLQNSMTEPSNERPTREHRKNKVREVETYFRPEDGFANELEKWKRLREVDQGASIVHIHHPGRYMYRTDKRKWNENAARTVYVASERLCEFLELPEAVKDRARWFVFFFERIVKDHRDVCRGVTLGEFGYILAFIAAETYGKEMAARVWFARHKIMEAFSIKITTFALLRRRLIKWHIRHIPSPDLKEKLEAL